jgi:hypothetical protein
MEHKRCTVKADVVGKAAGMDSVCSLREGEEGKKAESQNMMKAGRGRSCGKKRSAVKKERKERKETRETLTMLVGKVTGKK